MSGTYFRIDSTKPLKSYFNIFPNPFW